MMRTYSIRAAWYKTSLLFIVALSLIVPGCGRGVGNLSGTVSYKNKTLCSGSVLVVGGDGIVKSGPIDSDGVYEVKGIAVGTVKILVNSPQPGVPAKIASARPGKKEAAKEPPPAELRKWFPIPEAYADFDKSDLTFQLKSGANRWDIDLE